MPEDPQPYIDDENDIEVFASEGMVEVWVPTRAMITPTAAREMADALLAHAQWAEDHPVA